MEKAYQINDMAMRDTDFLVDQICAYNDPDDKIGGKEKSGGERNASDALKNRKNKGFTLVELIVVIVILAILAAILVPALLGYIDKAKKADILLRAKSAMTGAQTGLSEAYAKGIPQNNAVVSTEVLNAIYVTAETAQDAHIEIVLGKGTWNPRTATTDRSATSGNHKLYTICGFCYSESTSNTNWKEDENTVFYVYDETTGVGSWDATMEEYEKCKNNGYSTSFYKPFGY